MLKPSDIQLLTQTGPGTPMGELFRRFWLPALLSSELPALDCAPVRLRILNEDLVAFRDSSGQAGFVAEHCPHRGASMFFGRNEDTGIRCVYHGWKFDTSGACVDMPNEPPESSFKHKVKIQAYPALDRGGVIWIYMGPSDFPAQPPDLEWCLLPEDQRVATRWSQECNYAQAMEGDLDTTHVSFLHYQFGGTPRSVPRRSQNGQELVRDGAPKLTAREGDYGFCYGARRHAEGGHFWRVTQLLLPGYSIIPSTTTQLSSGAWFPVDDTHCMGWRFAWDYEKPLPESVRRTAGAPPELIPGTVKPVANKDNDYNISRFLQKTESFTGIADFRGQDTMATESMGAIMDRTKEHLGTADLGIIMYRRMLMRLARELQQGQAPYAATHPEVFRVRSLDCIDPASDLDGVLRNHDQEVFHPVMAG